jgi:hypothetical protein
MASSGLRRGNMMNRRDRWRNIVAHRARHVFVLSKENSIGQEPKLGRTCRAAALLLGEDNRYSLCLGRATATTTMPYLVHSYCVAAGGLFVSASLLTGPNIRSFRGLGTRHNRVAYPGRGKGPGPEFY